MPDEPAFSVLDRHGLNALRRAALRCASGSGGVVFVGDGLGVGLVDAVTPAVAVVEAVAAGSSQPVMTPPTLPHRGRTGAGDGGVSAHPASMVRVAATAISGAVRTRGAGLGC